MIIKNIEVFGLRLNLKRPFIVSYERYEDMPTLLIRIETKSGVVGWGEAVPDQHVTGETWESTFQIITNELTPLLINKSPFDISFIHKLMNEKIYKVPSAKAAIDIALYDLMGKLTGQPIYKLIGGRAHKEIQLPQEISLLSPEEMKQFAVKFSKEGFRDLKIKVGSSADTDIERIKMISKSIPNHVSLRVDANQGWTKEEAIYVIENTADCNVKYYEQPVNAEDYKSLVHISNTTKANIMADESIHISSDLLKLIELGGADLVNIKLMKSGGIFPAIALSNLAESANIKCHVGSMVESAIATMAGAHLSVSQSIIKSNDMVGPLMFAEDVAQINLNNDIINLSDAPGLGIDVNEAFIRENALFKG